VRAVLHGAQDGLHAAAAHGIGFATADQIAQKVGIPKDSINRAKAGIDHVLLEATHEISTGKS